MFYSELKDWQTAIAALLGFSGLIAAVIVSARKQRERDDHIRDQEIQAMARALRSEIMSITSFLIVRNENLKKIKSESNENKKITLPSKIVGELLTPPTPQVYERCMEKIGFLPSETSKSVMEYYGYLATTTRVVSDKIATHPVVIQFEEALVIISWYDVIDTKCTVALRSLNQFLKNNGGDAA